MSDTFAKTPPFLGQTFWFVPAVFQGQAKEVIVTYIGNDWAGLDNGEKMDLYTWTVHGKYFSNVIGQCYLDKSLYELALSRQTEWSLFYKQLTPEIPAGVSIENIRDAASTLSIKYRE